MDGFMNLKHALKLTFCGLLITLLSVEAQAWNRKNPLAPDYLEPQQLDPEKDTQLLNALGLNADLSKEPIVNLLFLAQDKRAPRDRAALTTLRDGGEATKALASRSDIIMVVSLNKTTAKWTIFSFYRGMNTPAACSQSSGVYEAIITDYYSAAFRRHTIPCLEYMTKQALMYHPELAAQYGGAPNSFRIHALIEGTKEETLDPLAASIKSIALGNKWRLTKLYGINGFYAAMSMFMSKDQLSKNLNGTLPDDKVRLDTDYLYVEAKERYIYPAGGYQRAFNFARLVSDFLGWVGYGLNGDPEVYTLFADAFNKQMSRSFMLQDFVTATRDPKGKSYITAAAYRNNMSPNTIVQFGPTVRSYSIFRNDKFTYMGGAQILNNLKADIQILAKPSSL
jgi:hypothetical protein